MTQLRTTICAVIAMCLVVGCKVSKPLSIHLVVPDMYVGKIEFVLDPENGMRFDPIKSAITLEIPKTGKVSVSSFAAFENDFVLSASFHSGTSLTVDPEIANQDPTNTVSLWSIGTISGTYYPKKTLVFIVGTAKQRDEIAGTLQNGPVVQP